MNLRIISTVISREYMTRVKKKSFLLLTFLAPLLFAALCVLPGVIMLATKEKVQQIAVVDRSGIVLPYLTDSETARYTDYSAFDADSVKAGLTMAAWSGASTRPWKIGGCPPTGSRASRRFSTRSRAM